MWKFNINKKGFTLIEVMFSVAIFSVLFLSALSFTLNNIRLKKYNDEIRKNRMYLETLNNIMLYNTDYATLENLKNEGRVYINSQYILVDTLKVSDFNSIMSLSPESQKPNVKIVFEGNEVLHIVIELYCNILGKDETLKCEFHKGNY
jgi:prepilin-type N-terminal cleavage/methylation domain